MLRTLSFSQYKTQTFSRTTIILCSTNNGTIHPQIGILKPVPSKSLSRPKKVDQGHEEGLDTGGSANMDTAYTAYMLTFLSQFAPQLKW